MLFSLALLLLMGGIFPQAASAETSKVLEFDTMIGLPRPYTGATNAIRGVPGGGLPWVVAAAEGELTAGGHLEVSVTGLVFDPNDQAVIDRGLGGINTVPNFKAIVSCMSKDANGTASVVNISTGLFPADAAGNSSIEADLTLPQPCIAPIIFVTNPSGSWFAATGM